MSKKAKSFKDLSPEEKKKQIISSAIELMSRLGILSTSFKKIADHCETSHSVVMYYFPSKLALLEAMVKQIASHNTEMVARRATIHDDAKTKLEKHFLGNLEWSRERRDEAQIILLLYYLGSQKAEFAVLYRAILGKARHRIKELLLAAQREGLCDKRLPVDPWAALLHDLLLGGLVNSLAAGISVKEAEHELKAEWDRIFVALFDA